MALIVPMVLVRLKEMAIIREMVARGMAVIRGITTVQETVVGLVLLRVDKYRII